MTERTALSEQRTSELDRLQLLIDYRFKVLSLLECALTHKSFSNEEANTGRAPVGDYESMEFLGDSILGFIISEFLFRTYPELSEGSLSKLKSQLVSTRELSQLSGKLNLADFLHLSRGEEKTGGRKKRAILADLFESLVAAIYLDGGIAPAREFVLEQFEEHLGKVARGELESLDFKSALQECLHSKGLPSPEYQLVYERGPDHEKQFFVSVSSEGNLLGEGVGRSKKMAERQAARQALNKLDQNQA